MLGYDVFKLIYISDKIGDCMLDIRKIYIHHTKNEITSHILGPDPDKLQSLQLNSSFEKMGAIERG